MADLQINSVHDLEEVVEKVGTRVVGDIQSCPYFRRIRKAAERFLRFAMKNIDVSDLPEGQRMSCVNDLARRLDDILKSENNVQDLHEFIGEVAEDALREVEGYMMKVEAVEQQYNTNGGI
jgi:hypothetical protein